MFQVYHSELKPFIENALAKKGGYRTFYLIVIISSLACFVFTGGYLVAYSLKNGGFIDLLTQLLVVLIAIPIVLIAHEGIHALGMLLVGIKRVSFGMSLKPLYFYATAVRASISSSKFIFLAMAPFAVLNSVFVLLFLLFSEFSLIWVTLLFIHTNGCAGDFGLSNFIRLEGIRQVSMNAEQAVTEFQK